MGDGISCIHNLIEIVYSGLPIPSKLTKEIPAIIDITKPTKISFRFVKFGV